MVNYKQQKLHYNIKKLKFDYANTYDHHRQYLAMKRPETSVHGFI